MCLEDRAVFLADGASDDGDVDSRELASPAPQVPPRPPSTGNIYFIYLLLLLLESF